MKLPHRTVSELMVVVAIIAVLCSPPGAMFLAIFTFVAVPFMILPLHIRLRAKQQQPYGSTWRDRHILAIAFMAYLGYFAIAFMAFLGYLTTPPLASWSLSPEPPSTWEQVALGLVGGLPVVLAGLLVIDVTLSFLRDTRWLPPRR
jgi:hypothetical protein